MKSVRRFAWPAFLAWASVSVTTTRPALAHWCNDLWMSGYNIVVRPATDTVTVPASGSASLNLWVQNNMGYPLSDFGLTVTATGYTVTATRATTAKTGFLLPGEDAEYTVSISKSGGGSLTSASLNFAVAFGSSGEDADYGTSSYGKPVMLKEASGALSPTTANITSGDQAPQLGDSVDADYGTGSTGLDSLLELYCTGRGSWNHNAESTTCTSTTITTCTAPTGLASGSATKYDYPKLWAAIELGARKSVIGTRAASFRTGLECGATDADEGFAGIALIVLGYLGADTGAQTFLQSQVTAAGKTATIAEAALLLMGVTTYQADVTAGVSSSDQFVADACAATLGIVNNDDTDVKNTLMANVTWTEPDTSDDGKGLYASHLLELVAWSRRGYAAGAADTGSVSFYPATGLTTSSSSSGGASTSSSSSGGASTSSSSSGGASTSSSSSGGASTSSSSSGGASTSSSSSSGAMGGSSSSGVGSSGGKSSSSGSVGTSSGAPSSSGSVGTSSGAPSSSGSAGTSSGGNPPSTSSSSGGTIVGSSSGTKTDGGGNAEAPDEGNGGGGCAVTRANGAWSSAVGALLAGLALLRRRQRTTRR
ncbi:MAG: hypothetical protein ABTD50_00240 [Polyangiaceae bacterium]|jgi:hypothetical protein